MQKLKKNKNNKLLNYQSFLKNNNLKKNQINSKKFLFENKILLKINDLNFNIAEINNKNILLPNNNNNIYSIKALYEDQILFNYNLNYNIIINFNKIILKNFIKKNKIIKGRIIGGNNKKIFVYIFGFIFSINPKKLNRFCNSRKNNFNNSKKRYTFVKPINIKRVIEFYKLRYLNFGIDFINNLLILSRISYINKLLKNKKDKEILKKKKRNFYRKLHAQKINQIKNN